MSIKKKILICYFNEYKINYQYKLFEVQKFFQKNPKYETIIYDKHEVSKTYSSKNYIKTINELENHIINASLIFVSFYQDIHFIQNLKNFKKNIIVNVWHGVPLRKIGFDNPIEKNNNLFNAIDWKNIIHLVPNNYAKQIFKTAFSSELENIKIIGEIENINKSFYELIKILINKTKLFNKKRYILFSPTHDQNFVDKDITDRFKIFRNLDEINNILKNSYQELHIKLHQLDQTNIDKLYGFSNIKIISKSNINNSIKLNDYSKFITDISSLINNWLLIKKNNYFLLKGSETFHKTNLSYGYIDYLYKTEEYKSFIKFIEKNSYTFDTYLPKKLKSKYLFLTKFKFNNEINKLIG